MKTVGEAVLEGITVDVLGSLGGRVGVAVEATGSGVLEAIGGRVSAILVLVVVSLAEQLMVNIHTTRNHRCLEILSFMESLSHKYKMDEL